jgi:TetR/AcrR family transcriptional regulator, transcriptional repressor for nem operon
MGRRKTYNREEITERAMRLFWIKGFHATSTRDLAEAMGVNPFSLYAEFGSKEALYDASIQRYEARVVALHFGSLETATSSLDDVRRVLEVFGNASLDPSSEMGCLLCNASTERAPSVEASRRTTARFVARLQAAFENALTHAARGGELVNGVSVPGLAASLVTHLMGVFVMMRACVDHAFVRAATDDVLARLDAITRPAD